MKIVIVNGSPRKGNTVAAIDAFTEGASVKNEVEIINTNKLNIKPCQGCNACQSHPWCIYQDDTNETVKKLVAADMIVFATPVYWWGMTAQLKLVIDKCYSRGRELVNKKIGVIIAGGSPVDSMQYTLINQQFELMAKYLRWDIVFSKSFFATERTELQNRQDELAELKEIGVKL